MQKEQKKRSYSQKKLIKLEKISFQIQAQKLRKEYSNKYRLNEMKMINNSKKRLLTQIPQKNIGRFLEPTKIISVTAHKWVIYDFYSNRYLRGYRAHDTHELSVFSKLLVFCAVNTLVVKHSIDMSRFETIATAGVIRMFKNNTKIKVDDIISLEDLLHLMIMEESQIYEMILSINIGTFIEKKRKKEYYSVFDADDRQMKNHLKIFYQFVNSYAKLLNLESIKYLESNPSQRKENKCSASDVGILSIQCLKIPLFMSILKKSQHSVKIKYVNQNGNLDQREEEVGSKKIANKFMPYSNVCRNWEEKNFMSSHCSLLFEDSNLELRPIVVVLLSCYGPIDREKDIQQVTEWYLKNGNREYQRIEGMISDNNPEKKIQKQKEMIDKKIEAKLSLKDQKPSRYDEAIKYNKSLRIKRNIKTEANE